MRALGLAAIMALALTGCSRGSGDANATNQAAAQAPIPQIPAPNNGNWAEVASRTPEGGTRIGNPNAPVKLIEYGSPTCPACQAFAATGTRPLIDTYVRSGQVSWEFRPLVIHGGPDVVLSMLMECQPEAAFFGTLEQVYAQQRELLANLDEAEQRQLSALPPDQQLQPLARAMALDTFFARRGMPEQRFTQCLSNAAAAQQLAANMNRALTEGVTGTPTFVLNGEKLEANTWDLIEPRLRAAIGG